MYKLKRIVALGLAVLLILALLPAIPAQAANNVTGYAGKSCAVNFEVKDAVSLNGTFSLDDPSGIVASYECAVTNRGGMKGGSVTGNTCFLYDSSAEAKPRTVTLTVTLNLKEGAAVGSTCAVAFTYQKGSDVTGQSLEKEVSDSAVVTVAESSDEPSQSTNPSGSDATTKPDYSVPVATTSPTKATDPTKNTSSTKATSATTATKPTTATEAKINYDKLNKQISIAEGLKEADYDPEAWKVFAEVLKAAKELTESKDQAAVDKAAEDLTQAITTLVGVDHSKLREAMDQVSEHSQAPVLSSLWYQMIDVLDNAEKLLESTDQAAVDAGTARLVSLLDQIEKAAAAAEPGTVTEQVPVEVEPSGDYCNIGIHKLWPILFFVSLALNVGFAAVIIVYLIRRKKNQQDDTPLVDYDIEDDMDDELFDELDGMDGFDEDLDGIDEV